MSFDLILPFMRPIESLLLDDEVSEIMGNPDSTWWVERHGRVCREQHIKFGAAPLRTGLEVIANHLGKRLDEDNPRLHAQLPDGSRIAVWIPPLVSPAPAMSIRKFTSRHYALDDLVDRGTLPRSIAETLTQQVQNGKTLLISGGTGSGKTTLLRVLAEAIPTNERVVVIEDTPELQCALPNHVRLLETKDVSLAKLLTASLRLIPKRLVLGEVREKKPARVLLSAWNTGHSGALATIHADDALNGLRKLETLIGGHQAAVRERIASAINVVVFVDGEDSLPAGRKVREVAVVRSFDADRQDYSLVYV